MKLDRRILAIAVVFGALGWTFDAFVDAFFFYEASFLGLLITAVPVHEVYIRLVLVVSYVAFGVIASGLVHARITRERELETRTRELEEMTAQLRDQYRTLFEEAPVMAVMTRDEAGRPIIEDCNDQFADTLDYDDETLVGRDLTDFYTAESRSDLLEEGGYDRALEGEFMRERRELLTADGETVETVLRAVPRTDEDGTIVGTLAMYVDITEREEVKRANEQLEQFTHIVSHDLRNPLNVASGRLELAREDCESDHHEAIGQALDRMNVLIDDLLTLAREGAQVGELSTVALADLAGNCWTNVETGEAQIRVETDRSIEADASRFQQLLENLFRNAIEHGGETVTVTIGGLEDGFYVADDGPGIPDDRTEAVFETGFSTSEDGTGFGLRIVKDIAEAHGWEVAVRDSESGGARFEFHGVETAGESSE